MPSVAELLYDSGTITAPGDSGWISPGGSWLHHASACISRGWLILQPEGLSGDETLDVVLDCKIHHEGGDRIEKLHDFEQVTSANADQRLILPGGESEAKLIEPGELTGAPFPAWLRFSHTPGGTSPSMRYRVFAALIFG